MLKKKTLYDIFKGFGINLPSKMKLFVCFPDGETILLAINEDNMLDMIDTLANEEYCLSLADQENDMTKMYNQVKNGSIQLAGVSIPDNISGNIPLGILGLMGISGLSDITEGIDEFWKVGRKSGVNTGAISIEIDNDIEVALVVVGVKKENIKAVKTAYQKYKNETLPKILKRLNRVNKEVKKNHC